MQIKACSCKSTYQDEAYGKGNRLHNPAKDGGRCTVCAPAKVKGSKRPLRAGASA